MWNINSISQIPPKRKTVSETNLVIFNPEHDLALAAGSHSYTPPPAIKKIINEYSLTAALYADVGDFILIPDSFPLENLHILPYYDIFNKKNLTPVSLRDLGFIGDKIKQIFPWGWNQYLRHSLLSNGIKEEKLPSLTQLDKLRNLSHRKTALKTLKSIYHYLDHNPNKVPVELFSVEEVEGYIRVFPDTFLKAPWSSSGRGIVRTTHISHKGLLEWAHGVIKKQGSVIVEPSWERVLDFASEWEIKEGSVKFLGYSIFKTSDRGKYHGNIEDSQKNLLDTIISFAPEFSTRIIDAQAAVLEEQIAPFYSGPLGIDMLVDNNGEIHPCVEINLRMTMGHISILKDTEN